MIKEIFLGRSPSHFKMDPVVKVFILSEMMLWSAWNGIIPIFALFAVSLQGGTIETAAFGYSVYLMSRVVFELVSGRMLINAGDLRKFVFSIFGISIVSIAYLGFAFSSTAASVYLYYTIAGLGLGIASPAKNSLFAMHLDAHKEAFEWSIQDALAFFCMAMAAFAGGLVAHQFGFVTLFLLAAMLNLISVLPYILYLQYKKR
jgi:MFS family permease